MAIINGQKIARKIKGQIKKEIIQTDLRPGLAVILIGKNPASKIYVRLKEKACREVGINFKRYSFPSNISQKRILELIGKLNRSPKVSGILIQFPLPKHLDADKIVAAIKPEKDVDGFHSENVKKLLMPPFSPILTNGRTDGVIISPVLSGVALLIKSTKINLKNKKALIVANSEIFARPMAKLLEKEGTVAEIYLMPENFRVAPCFQGATLKLKKESLKADILIVAAGSPKFIKAEMVRKNALVIDVGYNLIKGKSVGDVDFENVAKKAAFITPVPGGVGPMTVAMLLKNVLTTAKNQK